MCWGREVEVEGMVSVHMKMFVKERAVFTQSVQSSLHRLMAVSAVLIRSFPTGFGAAWHLASIDVKDLSTHGVWTFPCDRWLSESKDDKQIVRELICAKEGVGESLKQPQILNSLSPVPNFNSQKFCLTNCRVNSSTLSVS